MSCGKPSDSEEDWLHHADGCYMHCLSCLLLVGLTWRSECSLALSMPSVHAAPCDGQERLAACFACLLQLSISALPVFYALALKAVVNLELLWCRHHHVYS